MPRPIFAAPEAPEAAVVAAVVVVLPWAEGVFHLTQAVRSV